MKISLSPERIVRDHLVVWQDQRPQVDLTMDLKALTFRADSLDQIVAVHVLDFMFPGEAIVALKNWYACLKPGGKLFVVVDDFEYIARAFVGGDISIEIFNNNHSHASQYDRQAMSDLLVSSGFPAANGKVWFEGIPDFLEKKNYELMLEFSK